MLNLVGPGILCTEDRRGWDVPSSKRCPHLQPGVWVRTRGGGGGGERRGGEGGGEREWWLSVSVSARIHAHTCLNRERQAALPQAYAGSQSMPIRYAQTHRIAPIRTHLPRQTLHINIMSLRACSSIAWPGVRLNEHMRLRPRSDRGPQLVWIASASSNKAAPSRCIAWNRRWAHNACASTNTSTHSHSCAHPRVHKYARAQTHAHKKSPTPFLTC